MRVRASLIVACLVPFAFASAAAGQGIPVESELVRTACGACHQSDDAGRMSRISYMRKTPEGWQLTLKRMIRTGNVDLTPEQARDVVRYLSDRHGLAPEEERPVFYRAEKRRKLENIEDEQFKETCVRCHLGARFLSQRRTEEEWQLLKGMHIGYFPVIEFQTFRAASRRDVTPPEDVEEPPDLARWRVDEVLEKLAKRYPLETPAWKRFQAKGTPRGLEGEWLLSTHQPGKGPAAGVLTVTASGDDYTYSGEIVLADGSRHSREGKGVLYGGYSWRGSSNGNGLGELREVLMLSDDGSELSGRFFEGAFGELGIDVTLKRLGADAELAAVWPRSAPVGGGRQTVRLLGANFSSELGPGDLDFGQGITVAGITSRESGVLEVTIDVADDALPGYRDVVVATTESVDAFAVYDRVDYVKVLPEESLARVGGVNVPKEYAKFEAVAFHRGQDDEPLTEDDLNLGTVQPEWSIEEYHIRHEDDDVQYVGTIDDTGFFTPNREGPNTERELNADNFGDVWVVASYRPEGDRDTLLKGRARLVVTIPVYTYWDLFP